MVSREVIIRAKDYLFKGKALLITGPRQVGKSTLVTELVNQTGLPYLWLNGDEADVRENYSNTTSIRLKALIGNYKLVIFDEAQRITNIGITIKLLIDNFRDIQIIATGSSAFELANQINEPLTGRKYEILLLPFSYKEMVNYTSPIVESRLLDHRMIYGYYPEVVLSQGKEKDLLQLITNSYLYKDLFIYEKMKRPALFEKLIKAIALQLGKEVSYNELSQIVGADRQTVEKYIDLLEKAFVVFRLNAFSRNVRNELIKSKKIYFYDNGIRNAIVGNFNNLSSRTDLGPLWENFLISERLKYLTNNNISCYRHFWRTSQQQEIDYLEERDGKIFAWEFKWANYEKVRIPRTFSNAYVDAETAIIDRSNYIQFIGLP
jgi:uncharacterized protein